MNDVVRIKIHVGTGFAGASHEDVYEIPREEWEEMSPQQQEELLDELAIELRDNVIDCGAWVMEDDE